MTAIENVNAILTLISVIVTVISIASSIWSFRSAKSARAINNEVIHAQNTLELKSFVDKFEHEISLFQDQTRKRQWDKGREINTIISPFSDVLKDMGKYYLLFEDVHTLEMKVNKLYAYVQQFDRISRKEKNESYYLVLEISNILHARVQEKTSEVIAGR